MSDVLSIAKTLISLPSITPDDGGCQTFIRARLEQLGFHCDTMIFEGVTNLWARLGNLQPLIVFAGHTDVVPPGLLSDWFNPPFSPLIKDGYLYGRGTSDMKCAIAAMLAATEKFVTTHASFQGSIGFLITSDEEGPSVNGTKKVMEVLSAAKEKIDFCIVGEPSSEETVGDRIRVGRRGSLHGKLRVQGKQGHVANPDQAINPIHLSLNALKVLAETVWDHGNQDFPATTFQLTNIHAGTGALNVIPGNMEADFNFRYGSVSAPEDLMHKVKVILDELNVSHSVDWKNGAEPFLTTPGKLLEVTKAAIQEITQQTPVCSTGGGTSDARFIAPTGAEVIELGLSNATAHQVNEHVKVSDLEQLEKIYLRMLEKLTET